MTNLYVTALGSLKGPDGNLYLPGDIFPATKSTSAQLVKLIDGRQLCDSRSQALNITRESKLPMLETSPDASDGPAQFKPGDNAEVVAALERVQEAQAAQADSPAELRAQIARLNAELAARGAEIGLQEELVTESRIVHADQIIDNTAGVQDTRQQMLEAAKGQHFSEEQLTNMGILGD